MLREFECVWRDERGGAAMFVSRAALDGRVLEERSGKKSPRVANEKCLGKA